MKKIFIIFSLFLVLNACSSSNNEKTSTQQEETIENTTTENNEPEVTTEALELEKEIDESIEAVDELLNDL